MEFEFQYEHIISKINPKMGILQILYLHLWEDEVKERIGDSLGKFIYVDHSSEKLESSPLRV